MKWSGIHGACNMVVADDRVCNGKIRAPCGKCDACCGHYLEDGSNVCNGFALPRMERIGPHLLIRMYGGKLFHIAGVVFTACGISCLQFSEDCYRLGEADEITCSKCKPHAGYVADYLVEDLLLNPRDRNVTMEKVLRPLFTEALKRVPEERCEHKLAVLKSTFNCPCLPPCRCHWGACREPKKKLDHPKGQIRCDNPPWRLTRPFQAPATPHARGSLEALRDRFSKR